MSLYDALKISRGVPIDPPAEPVTLDDDDFFASLDAEIKETLMQAFWVGPQGISFREEMMDSFVAVCASPRPSAVKFQAEAFCQRVNLEWSKFVRIHLPAIRKDLEPITKPSPLDDEGDEHESSELPPRFDDQERDA